VISEHLCWGANAGVHFNDLLPLPYTEESLRHVAERIRRFQDAVGRRVLIENVFELRTLRRVGANRMGILSRIGDGWPTAGCCST
jgi:uncharacterized protein (UPF0276 family)